MIAESDKDLPNPRPGAWVQWFSDSDFCLAHRRSLVRSQVKPVFHSRAIEHVPSIDRRYNLNST